MFNADNLIINSEMDKNINKLQSLTTTTTSTQSQSLIDLNFSHNLEDSSTFKEEDGGTYFEPSHNSTLKSFACLNNQSESGYISHQNNASASTAELEDEGNTSSSDYSPAKKILVVADVHHPLDYSPLSGKQNRLQNVRKRKSHSRSRIGNENYDKNNKMLDNLQSPPGKFLKTKETGINRS